MKYFKILFFLVCFIDKVLVQWYVRLADPPYFIINCEETLVSSILQCVAIGRTSKDVRIFFNVENNHCRSHCTFLFNGSKSMGDDWHHYAIVSKRNAAFLKTSYSSTVYHNSPSMWGPQFATDGIVSSSSTLNIFHSDEEQTPWFMVALDRPNTIQFIRIFNRLDAGGERFHDVVFEVSIDGNTFDRRGFFKGPGMTDQVVEVLFSYPTIGKYVRMTITQGANNILHFAEVEIHTSE